MYVDGLKVGTLNEYSAIYMPQMAWTSDVLSAGVHTVRLVHKTGSMINIDAVQVMP